jgi:hypothetical protein
MAVQEGIGNATEFELKSLVLTSATGGQVDLREIMQELNIFEDLYANVMTGNLLIQDTQNLINRLPIVGAEYLSVTFIKPSTTWQLKKTFRVHRITNRSKVTAASETYMLHFCSEELILSQSIKVSNSYKDMTVANIIRDIAYNYLQISSEKLPQSELTPTTGDFSVVVPFWSPFYAINWLARMASTARSTSCSFMFFEDSLGFHFNSIENLSQQAPLQAINFMPMNFAGATREKSKDKTDMQQRLEAAESYELVSAPDTIDLFNTGVYSSKLMTVNVLDQAIRSHEQDGLGFFNDTRHANDFSYLQDAKDRTHKYPTRHHEAYYRVAVDQLKVETWLLQRNAYIAGMHGYRVKVAMPGNMLLRVGQVVTLNLPVASVGFKEGKPMDELLSGNYLITSIRHKLDRVKYVCILELSKDSITDTLPAPLENSGNMSKLRNS